jgi:hypothetical protein
MKYARSLRTGEYKSSAIFSEGGANHNKGPNGILENGSYSAHPGPGFDLNHVGAMYSHGYGDGKSEQGKKKASQQS